MELAGSHVTLRAVAHGHRFLIPLAALVALMLAAPFVAAAGTGHVTLVSRITMGSLFIVMLLAAVLAVSRSRVAVIVAGLLATPAIVMWLVNMVVDRPGVEIANNATSAFYLLYVIIVILGFMFSTVRVSVNTIAASVCVYLLLAVLWAEIFSIIELAQPGSFSYADTSSEIVRFGRAGNATAIYFSLVTMTTLGYGDITPRTAPARSLAAIEAAMGQIYLAVLVARLVGMHIAAAKTTDGE